MSNQDKIKYAFLTRFLEGYLYICLTIKFVSNTVFLS